MVFNLFDNNLATTVAVNSKYKPYKEIVFPFFRIWFKKLYKVDKIVIYNGFQKSEELYLKNSRAKDISITVLNYTEKEKGVEYSISIETNIFLNDTKEPQVINLPDVSGEQWIVDFQSTYPGSVYDDICISEIEFWYKGKKYEVKNLEKAKKEYVKMRRKKMIWDVRNFEVAWDVSILDNLENLSKRFRELGINPDEIELNEYVDEFAKKGSKKVISGFYFQFTYESETNGSILSLRKNGKMINDIGGDKGPNTWYRIVDAVKIGEWKVDSYGNLWIKVGKGKWKIGYGDYWFDKGTDFGEISIMSPIG